MARQSRRSRSMRGNRVGKIGIPCLKHGKAGLSHCAEKGAAERREERKKTFGGRFSPDKYKLGIIPDLIVYKPETNCYSKEDTITDAFDTVDAQTIIRRISWQTRRRSQAAAM